MHPEPDISHKYNIIAPKRIVKEVALTPQATEYYFKIVFNAFHYYRQADTETVTIKTFL